MPSQAKPGAQQTPGIWPATQSEPAQPEVPPHCPAHQTIDLVRDHMPHRQEELARGWQPAHTRSAHICIHGDALCLMRRNCMAYDVCTHHTAPPCGHSRWALATGRPPAWVLAAQASALAYALASQRLSVS